MLRRDRQLKNHAAEAGLFHRRAVVGFVVVALALIGLGAWYFRLQVLQHAEFVTRSEANRLRLVPVVPARGLILDRKGWMQCLNGLAMAPRCWRNCSRCLAWTTSSACVSWMSTRPAARSSR